MKETSILDTAGAISKRVSAGEYFDVLVLPPTALNAFASAGLVEKTSMISLAKVAIINPASGGSSGIYLEALFERMGLADEVKSKAVLVNGGLVSLHK